MEARSYHEQSIGDLMLKEQSERALRLKVEAEQFSQFSFKPTTNSTWVSSGGVRESKSKLQLSDPDTYLARLEEDRKKQEEKRVKYQKDRELLELQDCTFTPEKSTLPAYVKRLSDSIAIARKHREKLNTEKPNIGWK
jgi:putative heme iron utilization protein